MQYVNVPKARPYNSVSFEVSYPDEVRRRDSVLLR